MLYRGLLLALATTHAWNDCSFPEVGYFALDEGVGISYTYALAAMNGKMYSGGYSKGNFAFVGVTDSADVNPVPSATLWGDTTSDVQNLYVAEVNSVGSMTKGWHFKGSAIQVGQIGHGRQTNSIDGHSGMHAMLDKAHIAVKGGFRQLLTLPDGTQWSSANRVNTKDQVPFVMKIDVSSTQGIGLGTTGWAKLMDTNHAGGASVWSVDGDANGNMIVSYEGCSGYNESATSTDAYGRTVMGAMTGCIKYLTKLSATDGSEVWKNPIPVSLSSCRVVTGGSFFCGWTMTSGTVDFGNSVTVASVASTAGIVKFDNDGVAQWAKSTASMSFEDLAISNDGMLLAVIGYGARGQPAEVARIDTSSGNEGTVLWTDPGGVGTHGLRGVEVTDDGTEVIVFGQVTGTETLSDTSSRTTTLRSRGSFEVFVAAYDASDGTGKYAMDGGGTGMEYFFAMASDPDTKDVYVGGTSRSEHITWGDVKRKNVMYNGEPGKNNPDTSSAVGSSKAFTVKIKSTTALPSCLNTCNPAFPLMASDVKTGFCYIDRHCYADGNAAPYAGAECQKCDASATPLSWSDPDKTSHCFISGKCVAEGAHGQVQTGMGYSGPTYGPDPCSKCIPSVSTTAYSPVIENGEKGCMLDMATFTAACYDDQGNMTMTETDKVQLMADKVSMTNTMATRDATIATHADTIKGLETSNIQLAADLKTAKADNDTEEKMPTWAIAIIVVIGAMFLLVLVILGVIVSREQQGKPVFVPSATKKSVGAA